MYLKIYMTKRIRDLYRSQIEKLGKWAQKRFFGLFLFNVIIMVLIILRSAGYFDPFFPLTINFIVFFSFILAILLLNVKSNVIFYVSYIFWLIAAGLRMLNIDVWAERTSIYTFQALLVGLVLFLIEIVSAKKRNSTS